MADAAPVQTLRDTKICSRCQADNAPAMKFCRQCGTQLSAAPNPVPNLGPDANSPNLGHHDPSQAPVSGVAQGGGPQQKSQGARTIVAPAPLPQNAAPKRPRPASPTPPPGSLSRPHGTSAVASKVQLECESCGGKTPSGFSFCQRCGKTLASSGAANHATTASVQAATLGETAQPAPLQAASFATVTPQAPPSQRPTPKSLKIASVAEPAWASLISVNRDGSDGVHNPLRGDYVELGNTLCTHLRFDDPYLSNCHARIERLGTGSARVVPLDRLNGVFRRIRQDTHLEEGALILLGRELLRFELLASPESKPTGLKQHGVALFGSPLREAWGRVSQLLPSGGIRDVRHLYGEEMVIGREEGDIVFGDDEFLSRRHAALRFQYGQCVLADLGSSNGTFLRLIEPANLSAGDFLRIGDQMFRFKPEV